MRKIIYLITILTILVMSGCGNNKAHSVNNTNVNSKDEAYYDNNTNIHGEAELSFTTKEESCGAGTRVYQCALYPDDQTIITYDGQEGRGSAIGAPTLNFEDTKKMHEVQISEEEYTEISSYAKAIYESNPDDQELNYLGFDLYMISLGEKSYMDMYGQVEEIAGEDRNGDGVVTCKERGMMLLKESFEKQTVSEVTTHK